MKSRSLFFLILAASIASHVAVLLLVRLETPARSSSPEAVRISLRRVAAPPPAPPPPAPPPVEPRPQALQVETPPQALPVETPREEPPASVPAESPPQPKEQVVGEPQPEIHTAPAEDTHTAPVPSRDEATRIATDAPPVPQPTEMYAEEEQRILDELRHLIVEQVVYPPLARRRGLEGRVVLRLALDTDGSAESLVISESSGHSILDRAALELLERLLPLDRGPTRVLTLEIPIAYRLTR